MHVKKFLLAFLVYACCSLYCSAQPARRQPAPTPAVQLSQAEADTVARKFFRARTRGKVVNFSWRFIYDNGEEWVFSFEDLDIVPGPGTDYFVSVHKKTGKIRFDRGM